MKRETYFKKNGCIYGMSTKWNFGKLEGYAYKFTDLGEAIKWLNAEEYGFRTRVLTTKTAINAANISYLGVYR